MTSSPSVNCPLCYQPAFNSLAALSVSLINVTTKSLQCPVCQESLPGLDKFTIHIFSHALNHEISHRSQQNGVLKVIASTSAQNVVPIDIGLPVFIRQIDGPATDESYVLKDALHLNKSRLTSSNNDNNDKTETKNPDDRMLTTTQECESNNMKSFISNYDGNINTNHDNNIQCTNVKGFITNIGNFISINHDNTSSRTNTEAVITNIDSHIDTNHDDNNISRNNMEGTVAKFGSQICSKHDIEMSNNNMKGVISNIESHISMKPDNSSSRIDHDLKDSSNVKEATCSDISRMSSIVQKDKKYIESGCNTGIKNNDSSISDFRMYRITQEKSKDDVSSDYNASIESTDNSISDCKVYRITQEIDGNFRSDYRPTTSCMKNTDSSSFDYNVPNSDSVLGYSQDNSNDLLKNLEPYIKYGSEKVDKMNGNRIFVEDGSIDEDLSSKNGRVSGETSNIEVMVKSSSNSMRNTSNLKQNSSNLVKNSSNLMENSSNLVNYTSNLVENTSNTVQTCEAVTSNLTAMECLNAGDISKEIVHSQVIDQCEDFVGGDSIYVSKVLNVKEVHGSFGGCDASSINNTSIEVTSNLEQACENVTSFTKLTAMQCSNSSELSTNTTSSIHHNITVKEVEDKHYEVIPILFEPKSVCGLQNDGVSFKSKYPKKEVKGSCKKVCKKLLDSTMTTQGVQTMEESFTKNNNPFGKLLTVDGMTSEDFVNVDGSSVSDERNNVVFDRRNMVSLDVSFENSTNSDGLAVCDLCLFTFPDQNILQMHKKLVHSDCDEQKKTFSCHLCSKSFNMRGSLMVHRRVAHPVLSGGQVSLKNIERINEMKASTSFDDTTHQFNCKTCGKSFKKEQHLTQHERTHEVKQWECDICSKVFSTKYFLKKHKRLHTGEMPYTCATCGKSFTFQQSYHKHLLYHSDEKPHVCCECGRAFKELSTLHNHQRIHTGEKPFACETCGKCFRQRVSYLVHRRIHTGVMPYKCTICNKSFRYKVSERTHKCNNTTQGHAVVDKMSEMVEKLQKLEGTNNTNSNKELSVSLSSSPGSLHTTPSNTATTNVITAETCSNALQPDLNHSTQGVVQLKQQPNDKMDVGGQEFWTEIPKPTSNHRNTSSDDNNIFSAESSDDFLSFVLTPTFSPSEQFQNLTLSPDRIKERGTDGTRNTEEGTIRDGYHDGNFETINEQSLKELLDNVDVL